MSIIVDDLKFIAPKSEFLKNKIVMAQAWKKAHSYIRRHNWYADTLELDLSTINLEKNLEDWCKASSYSPDNMSLVLAPKNAEWEFPDDEDNTLWRSIKDDKAKSQKLRALAHLSLKDQTISTAAMLCLADAIESAQGSTNIDDFFLAQKKEIYSYGNRLQCEWVKSSHHKEIAQFGWGNSLTYRQYYEDYQKFLTRPRNICQKLSKNLDLTKKLCVVSLDLKGFYDQIDRTILLNELKILYKEFFEVYNLEVEYEDDPKFWEYLNKIFSWKWDSLDIKYAGLINGDEKSKNLPQGIPQGLVSGGFFANAYLIRFDRVVGKLIGEHNDGFVLRDYCRYVDDIRLVVEIEEENFSDQDYTKIFNGFFNKKLKDYFQTDSLKEINLKVNSGKTKIQLYENISNQNDISMRMNSIQGIISGTPDVESLEQAVGGLDSLLQLSENLFEDEKSKSTKMFNKLELSYISALNIDVKNDTLKRFAAARLVKALRLKKTMFNFKEDINYTESILDSSTKEGLLDHEFETFARKLVALWSRNPSLSLLMKCGLDLYPDIKILRPILKAVEYKLYSNNFINNENDFSVAIEKKAMEYIASDLLYAGAVRIGYKAKKVYPEKANIILFREELTIFAEKILANYKQNPWYLQQQASLFLASVNKYNNLNLLPYSKKSRSKKSKQSSSLYYYRILHEALQYKIEPGLINDLQNFKDYFIVSLVVQQIVPNLERYITWFNRIWADLDDAKRKKAIEILSLNRPDILIEILKIQDEIKEEIKKDLPYELVVGAEKPKRNISVNNNKQFRLIDIISNEKNPFQQENALLLLANALLENDEFYKKNKKDFNTRSISEILIRCNDWSKIQNLITDKGFLKIDFKDIPRNKISEKPDWVKLENAWTYNLGQILRSSLTGEFDFTAHSFLTKNNSESYRGLRSTWFTRRFGMSNNAQSLFEDAYPISPWISELLLLLLQWPGINYHERELESLGDTLTKENLQSLILNRIKLQKKVWGSLSETPMYTMPVYNSKTFSNPLFRVITAQTLLPTFDDFDEKDPLHWTDSFRARHRSHIASVCNLISQYLTTSKTTNRRGYNENIDLIVFPELTIHPDDLDLLRGLSDATGASIFAGMTFTKRSKSEQYINQGIWMLRSEKNTGREFNYIWQGKKHMTESESSLNIEGFRPYQLLVDFKKDNNASIRVASAICYDSTDLSLVADLRDVSDIFVIVALNQDVDTFDNMVSALHYHMYQPVILVNTGEFGGSTVKAPFTKHEKTITQVHGNNQLSISLFEIDPHVFKSIEKPKKVKQVKTPPAGYKGR
ncbi:RNA-directed DNA polymerase [Paenibacillus kandeliae]|uniref:RNA-directed DNA polymerase n=1 Tax=Paenibacillus kandeliae TaxID=3231269 RepID=UPI003459A6A3